MEALATVCRAHSHQHDLVQRLQQAHAVDHPRGVDVEALERLVDHGLDGFFRHARVVLQLHGADALAIVAVANGADEAADGANALVLLAQRGDFGGEIEVAGLDADAGVHAQPPVTGGKKPTSAPSLSAAASSLMVWLSATRTARPCARTSA